MLRKPKIRIFFGNLDIENYLKLSFPWNSWVRTVISLKLSCLAWNLSCVKLFWREIIYANECDEAGDPVGGHFRKTTPALQPAAYSVAWDLRFPIGISRLIGFKYTQMQSKIFMRQGKTGQIGSQESWIILTRVNLLK